jgi:hypothetical protein
MEAARPQKQSQGKKRKIVGNAGACLTSDEAVHLLQSESAAKRQKLEETAERKRISEEKRVERERETQVKRSLMSEKRTERQNEDAKNKQLKAVKKQNKARKVCECGKKIEDDQKSDQKLWLFCFECWAWCCHECLPSAFKAKTNSAYVCEECIETNED